MLVISQFTVYLWAGGLASELVSQISFSSNNSIILTFSSPRLMIRQGKSKRWGLSSANIDFNLGKSCKKPGLCVSHLYTISIQKGLILIAALLGSSIYCRKPRFFSYSFRFDPG